MWGTDIEGNKDEQTRTVEQTVRGEENAGRNGRTNHRYLRNSLLR